MRKVGIWSSVIGASLATLFAIAPANAAPITVNFNILNNATTVANGSLTYASGSGPITSFSGFSAFSITFDTGATQTFSLSQLTPIPAADTFVDFNTTTNTFQFGIAPGFYGLNTLLAADNAGNTVDFIFYNNGSDVYSDNGLNIFSQPWTSVSYSVVGQQVPEPFTLSLFGAGLAGAGVLRRRKKAKKA